MYARARHRWPETGGGGCELNSEAETLCGVGVRVQTTLQCVVVRIRKGRREMRTVYSSKRRRGSKGRLSRREELFGRTGNFRSFKINTTFKRGEEGASEQSQTMYPGLLFADTHLDFFVYHRRRTCVIQRRFERSEEFLFSMRGAETGSRRQYAVMPLCKSPTVACEFIWQVVRKASPESFLSHLLKNSIPSQVGLFIAPVIRRR